MSRSAQTAGRSSLRTPSRSMRWPPVSLIIGTSYLSATSAIWRSCAEVVTPPFICGTTENVPSRWMLACTRSLMNRASRSSTNSSAHIISSSDARRHLGARRPPAPSGASAANTDDTECNWSSRIVPHQLGLVIGDAGHVPARRRVLLDVAAGGPLDDLRDQLLARPAALARPGRGHHAGDRLLAVAHAGDQRALADAVAVAHLRVVGQLGHADLDVGGADVEHQRHPFVRQRQPAVERLHQERRPC